MKQPAIGAVGVKDRRDDASRGAVSALGHRLGKKIASAVVPRSMVVWRGPSTRRRGRPVGRVALTFDDGPTSLTPAYLHALSLFHVRATFFVIGELCARRPDLVRAIAVAGHELAGHGYTHRRFPTLTRAELEEELLLTQTLLPKSALRRPLVRPPHGAVSPASIFTCARAGFTTALWSHDSGDWRTERTTDVLAAFDDEAASTPGAVVLLHEGQEWTMNALPMILRKLQREGHEVVPMGELLHG